MGKKICLFFLVLLVYACSSPSVNPPLKVDRQKLLPISLANEVRSLDPAVSVDSESQSVVRMLFEGLMATDCKGNLTPAIAERYEVSEDLKKYTFFLRPCKWSNGKEISAFDFEYSWKKVVKGNLKGSAVHNFYPVKNVQAILQGHKPLSEMGIKAVDSKTFVVELEYPAPYFLEAVATSSFFPICAEVDQSQPEWSRQVGPAFVCNGPFVLQDHKNNDEIVLLKNPLYWDKGAVKLPGIHISIIKETRTQLHMFEKGELAWVGRPLAKIPPDAIPSLKKKGELTFVPSLGIYWYFLNTQTAPFNNKKMRLAFAYAMNRKEIADHVLQEGEKPAMGVLPTSLCVHSGPYFADGNFEQAKILFQEALKEMGITKEQLPPIVLSLSASEYSQRIAQVVQQYWEKTFGIHIRIEQQEWKVHYQKLLQGNFQIGAMGWNSWLKDPIYIMQTFRYRADGINMSHWEHPAYQQLIDAAEKEPDPEKRCHIFHEAEKLLMEEMPIIPVYFTSICYTKKDCLKNVHVSELNQVNFKWASFEPNTR